MKGGHQNFYAVVEVCKRVCVYDSERILSMDWFKKSLREVRSALGNRDVIASRAVLEKKKRRHDMSNKFTAKITQE